MPNNMNNNSYEDTLYLQQTIDRNLSNVPTDDAMTPASATNHPLFLSASSPAMRLRRRRGPRSTNEGGNQTGEAMQESEAEVASPEERMFHMKRQWFFVAEVTDKFAFLIYLVTMSFTIFMILYVVPVYMRNDPVMT